MGRVKHTSCELRAQMLILKQENLSNCAIGKKLGVTESCVRKALKRFEETGSNKNRKKSGRPSLSTPRSNRMIRRIVMRSPTKSSRDIEEILASQMRQAPSCRTIRRILVDKLGLRARRPCHKPLLNPQQRKRRIEFCKRHQGWTIQDWADVMFSDESSFKLWGNGATFVRRPVGERYNMKYILPTVKKYESIMIWGCFGNRGRGRLFIVPKGVTINAVRYIDILRDRLLAAMDALGTGVFQHDNAPCHAARIVQQFLGNHGVRVLDWPGNSPDLNPIENLWHYMKRRVRAKCPKTVPQLQQAILEVWVREISPDYCEKLIRSMPSRIAAVLKNHGYPTKY